MVEFVHQDPAPSELVNFNNTNPNAPVEDFDSDAFQMVKNAVKAALNQDQGGLCVYCEKARETGFGHVEHIRPKGGDNAHPHLCFTYTNYAFCCMVNRTCGMRKGNTLLPIEPGPTCNDYWMLSTDGYIISRPDNTPTQNADVANTLSILGLNYDSDLVDERNRWFKAAIIAYNLDPNGIKVFLQDKPFRHILTTAF